MPLYPPLAARGAMVHEMNWREIFNKTFVAMQQMQIERDEARVELQRISKELRGAIELNSLLLKQNIELIKNAQDGQGGREMCRNVNNSTETHEGAQNASYAVTEPSSESIGVLLHQLNAICYEYGAHYGLPILLPIGKRQMVECVSEWLCRLPSGDNDDGAPRQVASLEAKNLDLEMRVAGVNGLVRQVAATNDGATIARLVQENEALSAQVQAFTWWGRMAYQALVNVRPWIVRDFLSVKVNRDISTVVNGAPDSAKGGE